MYFNFIIIISVLVIMYLIDRVRVVKIKEGSISKISSIRFAISIYMTIFVFSVMGVLPLMGQLKMLKGLGHTPNEVIAIILFYVTLLLFTLWGVNYSLYGLKKRHVCSDNFKRSALYASFFHGFIIQLLFFAEKDIYIKLILLSIPIIMYKDLIYTSKNKVYK